MMFAVVKWRKDGHHNNYRVESMLSTALIAMKRHVRYGALDALHPLNPLN